MTDKATKNMTSLIRCCDCNKKYEINLFEDGIGDTFIACPHCKARHSIKFDSVITKDKLFFIGEIKLGADAPPDLVASRILNATRVAQGADDTDVADWDISSEFIVVFQIDEAKGPWQATYKIQWQDVTDASAYVDLGTTGELIQGTSTDLVNGNAVTSGEQACTNNPAGSTWQDGEEIEGANLSDSINLADEYYTELHYAVNPTNADAAHKYAFRLWENTNSVLIGVALAEVTVAVGAVSIPLATANITANGQALTVSAPPPAINLSTANITASGQALTVVPGAVSTLLNTSLITANGIALTVSAPIPPTNINLSTASITANGQAILVDAPISISLNTAVVTVNGQVISVTSDIVIGLLTASLTATGQAISVGAGAIVSLSTANITASGQAITVTSDIVISLSTASITANGQAIIVDAGAGGINIILSTGTISANGQALTVVAGSVSISLATGLLTANGQAITVSTQLPPINVNLATGSITANGQALSVIPGGVSVILATGLIDANGQTIIIQAIALITMGMVSVSDSARWHVTISDS